MNPNNELESVDNLKSGQCGNSIGSVVEACPKCGEIRTVRQDGKKYLEVDVAHAGSTLIDDDEVIVKAGSIYTGNGQTTTTAGSVMFRPELSTR